MYESNNSHQAKKVKCRLKSTTAKNARAKNATLSQISLKVSMANRIGDDSAIPVSRGGSFEFAVILRSKTFPWRSQHQ
jgi:hypothetical protein